MWEAILVLPNGKIAQRYLRHSEGGAWNVAYNFNRSHRGHHGLVMLHRKVEREEEQNHGD